MDLIDVAGVQATGVTSHLPARERLAAFSPQQPDAVHHILLLIQREQTELLRAAQLLRAEPRDGRHDDVLLLAVRAVLRQRAQQGVCRVELIDLGQRPQDRGIRISDLAPLVLEQLRFITRQSIRLNAATHVRVLARAPQVYEQRSQRRCFDWPRFPLSHSSAVYRQDRLCRNVHRATSVQGRPATPTMCVHHATSYFIATSVQQIVDNQPDHFYKEILLVRDFPNRKSGDNCSVFRPTPGARVVFNPSGYPTARSLVGGGAVRRLLDFQEVRARAEQGELLDRHDMQILFGLSQSGYYKHAKRGNFDRFKTRPAIGPRCFSGTKVARYLKGELVDEASAQPNLFDMKRRHA